jgi:hypothetical protein
MKEFYILELEDFTFKNQEHYENFLKYLFSISKRHKKNFLTRWNSFYLDDTLNFNIKPDYFYKTYMENNKLNFEQVRAGLFYCLFFIEFDNYFVSNFINFYQKEGKTYIKLLYPEQTINEFGITQEKIKNFYRCYKQNKKPVYNYHFEKNKIRDNIIVEIEKEFHLLKHTSNTILSFSHNDQVLENSIYHIHQLKTIKEHK